jgi:hypothetical protein
VTSIGKLSAGQADYYVGNHQAPGYWLGGGSLRLGAQGTVDRLALTRLLDRTAPGGGHRLVPERDRRVPGFDVTFLAPKSVSVLSGRGAARLGSREVRDHTLRTRKRSRQRAQGVRLLEAGPAANTSGLRAVVRRLANNAARQHTLRRRDGLWGQSRARVVNGSTAWYSGVRLATPASRRAGRALRAVAERAGDSVGGGAHAELGFEASEPFADRVQAQEQLPRQLGLVLDDGGRA